MTRKQLWTPKPGDRFRAWQELPNGGTHYHRAGVMVCTESVKRRPEKSDHVDCVYAQAAKDVISLDTAVWAFERVKE